MDKTDKKEIADGGEQSLESLVRMVGVIRDGKFVPYGTTGITGGKPVYFFDTYADYEAAAPMLPEECMFVTLDDVDTGGFEFDSELSETSENAVQNKIITAALRKKASFDSPGVVQFTDSETVTDRNSGLALWAGEKNAALEGTLANSIERIDNKTDQLINKKTITLTNIDMTSRSGRGAYYSADPILFSDYGIDGSKVISASIRTWAGAVSSFNIYYDEQGFQFISDVEQVVYNMTVGVCYKS